MCWIPALGLALAIPFYEMAYFTTTPNINMAWWFWSIGALLHYTYLGSQYTIGQGVVSAQTRALSTAVLMFMLNLLGYGLGPLFIGWLSDVLFSMKASALGAADLTRAACEGAARPNLPAKLEAVCATAHPQSLQQSLLVTASLYALSGLFFLLTCRWLKQDLVAK